MFPQKWEVSERIAVQFCHDTREELTKIMTKRKHEIDVKLLLYAIQKTSNFENLLSKRFTGVTLNENAKKPPETPEDYSEFRKSPFTGLIGRCFVPHLKIYIDSIDANLADLIERFQQDEKAHLITTETSDTHAIVLPSCADLFVFYKKSMIQCTQLDKGQSMLDLTRTFQKYLREYSAKLLQNNLPKLESQSLGTSVQNITRDLQKISTSGLIQNFSSLLKEGEITRFTKDEQMRICCILTTAEYCQETTKQLAEKLKEKIEPPFADQIDLSQEQDHFHRLEQSGQPPNCILKKILNSSVISNCIQLLVQDLENACEPALTAMSKVS